VSPEIRRAVQLLLAAVAMAGCDNDWRTDMWYQPSLRAEDAPRAEPEHSVALGLPPHLIDRDDAEDQRNPVPRDAASVARGRVTFRDRCVACHGTEGHGGGPVSKFFPPAPDLAYVAVKARSDGYIFGTITFGGRAMPPLGEGLTPKERWDLVNFVRVSVQGDSPHPDPLPPAGEGRTP
jgi:mono/diheme cytochrome c family protein